MLETLIKRNGERETFSNEKSNGWMIWGCDDLIDRLDWSSIVIQARSTSPEIMTTQEWQKTLINKLKVRGSQPDGWPYMKMAGRLYTVLLMKQIHGDNYPTLREQLATMAETNLSRPLNYSEGEIDFLQEHVINHKSNLDMSFTQVEQYQQKYALRDRSSKRVYETPQFTMMRMAMSVYENDLPNIRLGKVRDMYLALNEDLLNPPTPNYAALGTNHYGMASCCLIAAGDDAMSIKVADIIAYSMTLASAGIGMHLSTRAPGDPVDGGRVEHAGRLNYARMYVASCAANKQGMRGGALNIYDTLYSPEAVTSLRLQNPRTPIELRERRVNVTYQTNRHYHLTVAERQQCFEFSEFSAPDLYKAFFDADQEEFERLYAKYEADVNFKKTYFDAFDRLVMALEQEAEVSTLFWNDPNAMNAHTPFIERIIQSNLCMEVMVPTERWREIIDLYGDGNPSKGETGICNIGSIPVHNFPFNPKNPLEGYEKYKKGVRAQLEMIDFAIDNSEYHFPAIKTQAISRRNASVGMSGVATLFAQLGLKFNTPEGRKAWHQLNERHAFACTEVALEMGIERGNAPWMDRTKWPQGWMFIDTYKKTIDTVVDSTLYFDWENLRSRVIANKGIRFSCLIAHMPGEQATRKGTGSNSLYPLFNLSVDLTDGSSAIPWAALDNDLIGENYPMAWDMEPEDMIIHYGICQKFTDQGISADIYLDRVKYPNPTAIQLVTWFLLRVKYGLKSKYYTRSRTFQQGAQADIAEKIVDGVTVLTPVPVGSVKVEAPKTMSALDRIAAQIAAQQASQDDGLGAEAFSGCGIDGSCTN